MPGWLLMEQSFGLAVVVPKLTHAVCRCSGPDRRSHGRCNGGVESRIVVRRTPSTPGVRMMRQRSSPLFPLYEQFDRLSDAQREALRSALGFGSRPVPDRLLAANAVHTLLRQASLERPVFIVVDDLPRLDRASAAVFGFVARRLAGSRIGFLAASRSGAESFFERGQLTEYELPPLDGDAAMNLISAGFPGLAPRVRDRVLAQAQGNPLALLELPSALTGPQRAALVDSPPVLPLSQRLQALYVSRISDLPTACRRLLLLLALDGTGDLAVLQIATEACRA